MKRIMSFLLALFLIVLAARDGFVSSAHETDTEVIAYIDVVQNTSSTVDVTLSIIPSSQIDIAGMFFTISYVSNFGYEYSEFPFTYNEDNQNTNLIPDKQFASATVTNNPLLQGSFCYIWYDTDAVLVPAGKEITLATISLDIAKEFYPGTYLFSLSCPEFYCVATDEETESSVLEDVYVNTSSEVVPFYLEERIDASQIKYGDSNDDDEIDTKDLVLLRRYLANYNYDTGLSTVAIADGGDANGDGVIDTKDLVLVRRYLANYNYDTGSSTVVLGPQI